VGVLKVTIKLRVYSAEVLLDIFRLLSKLEEAEKISPAIAEVYYVED